MWCRPAGQDKLCALRSAAAQIIVAEYISGLPLLNAVLYGQPELHVGRGKVHVAGHTLAGGTPGQCVWWSTESWGSGLRTI